MDEKPAPIEMEKPPIISLDPPNLKDMSLAEIEQFICGLGKEKYRARQIMKWIYQYGVEDFSQMTDLAKNFRAELAGRASISALKIDQTQESSDGTIKILYRLKDALTVESVIIPGRNDRTLCISTQAGCRMGCRFCLTGKSGLSRNLVPSEITDQITIARFKLPEGKDIDNIVLMGMGEPLDNFDNVVRAIRIMLSDAGLAISTRKVTVSTCGMSTELIRRLGEEVPVNIAISLNASSDETRDMVMPVNRSYPIGELIRACKDYSMPKRRRITFEYVLLSGVNDSPRDAERLARLLRGVRCKINLIAFNEYPGSEFTTPGPDAVRQFREILVRHGYTAILRKSKGADILAACGQLSGKRKTFQ